MNINLIQKSYNRFSFNVIHMTPENPTVEVVIIFPGAGYSHLGPLLYYPTQWMLENNKAVIIADYDFRLFNESEDLNRIDTLIFCIKECLMFAKEKYPNSNFSFVGKSIGTQALCHLSVEAAKIGFSLNNSRFVWLTPVWKREEYLQMMKSFPHKSLYVIGDNDSHYSESSLKTIEANSKAKVVVIAGAEHSLDDDLNVEETFKIHRNVFNHIQDFLN